MAKFADRPVIDHVSLFHAFGDATGCGLALLTLDRAIVQINDRGLELLAPAPGSAVIGSDLLRFFHPADRSEIARHCDRLVREAASATPAGVELAGTTGTDPGSRLGFSIRALRDGDGRPTGLLWLGSTRREAGLRREIEAKEARSRLASLTGRERDVLDGLVQGWPNKTIAYDLGISPRTVEIYRANMMEKLHARSLSEALRIAFIAEGTIRLQAFAGS